MNPGPTHKVETKFGVKRRQRDRQNNGIESFNTAISERCENL